MVLNGLRTLRFKLFLSYMLVSVLPLFVLWAIISVSIEDHLLETRTTDLSLRANRIAATLRAENYMYDPDVRPRVNEEYLSDQSTRGSARIYVIDITGVVIYDSLGGAEEGKSWAHPNIMQALDGEHSYSTDEVQGGVSIHIAVPVTDTDGDNLVVIGAAMLMHTMTDAFRLVSGINSQILWLIVAIGAGVAVVVLIISAWLLNPLRHVLSAVKNISEGHLNQRIALRGKDEIYALGAAVNDMAQKLERTETARQEFVSNVSHELRTPLSSIKVLSESLLHRDNVEKEVYKEFLSDINSEVDRMADIIDELLTLVRLDEVELPLNISQFCLNNLLEEVIKRLRPLALVEGIGIEFSPSHQLFVEGDEMKLNLAISNLIENAVKYSYSGGLVKVLLDVDAKNVFVTVSDRGAGISEEDQAKVFSRFFRADRGRDRQTGGTGLGLAITHKTILLHKGSIKVSSKIGEGSIFTIRIPLQHKP